MKALRHFLAIVVVMVFVAWANQGFAKTQMLKWYFPGKAVDFREDPPDVIDLEGPKSGYVSDGICWSEGQTLFHIIDQYAYDRFGSIIPQTYWLEGMSFKFDVEDWLINEGQNMVIVPFPKSSDHFYAFTYDGNILYSVFNAFPTFSFPLHASKDYHVGIRPYIEGKSFFEYEGTRKLPNSQGCAAFAVSKPIEPTGEHYLYALDHEGIKRWTIGKTIHSKVTIVTWESLFPEEEYCYGMYPAGGEFELSHDGSKFAAMSYYWDDSEDREVSAVIVLEDDGLFFKYTRYPLFDETTEPPYASWTEDYTCYGLEFSPDGSKLYASFYQREMGFPSQSGIYWIDLSSQTPSWTYVDDSEDYCWSELELARNGLIYAARRRGYPDWDHVLKGIDLDKNQFSEDESTTITGVHVPYVWYQQKPFGYYDEHHFLPDQIDGFDYASLKPIWDIPIPVAMPHGTLFSLGGIKKGKGKFLSWSCLNTLASSYDVYFGTDYNDVYEATPDTNSVEYKKVYTNRYDPCELDLGTTYYWRVDAVNDANSDIWKGYVWMFKTNSCILPPVNMSAWWTFDEGTGTTAHDSAGWSQDDGTLTNGANFTSSGKVAGGLQLDGLDDFVEVTDSPELNFGTGDLSMDAWVRTSAASGGRVILDKREGTVSNPRGYVWYVYNGNLGFELADGTLTNYGSSLFVADGSWHHVAVTVDRDDPNGLVLYVDGVSATRDPTDRTGSLTNDHNLLIGEDCLGISSNFSGEIDEVELYRRALGANEIEGIYRAGSFGKCKPEPEWDCEQADLHQDGIVNWKDLAILANCWLESCR